LRQMILFDGVLTLMRDCALVSLYCSGLQVTVPR